MKASAFDSVARHLGETGTRREFFRLLGGATVLSVGAVGLREAAAARKSTRKKKPKKCRSWILSGGPSPTETIGVDDDLQITLNGVSILNDNNQMANELPPLSFKAKVGDSLAVTATDVHTACRAIDPLWLHCATSNKKRQLSAGQNDGCAAGRAPGVFFNQVFRIKV